MKNFLTVLLVLFATVPVVLAEVPKKERKVLLELYESTNGQDWIRTWDINNPVSTWYGVTVENDHVVEINLFRNNLKGVLPESIGKLEQLRVLNLAFNALTGELPPTVANLQDLQILKLEMNRFKGPIPSELGSMTELLELTAFNNFFS